MRAEQREEFASHRGGEAGDRAALDGRPFAMRAGLAEHRVGRHQPGSDRAEQLHLFAAHHVGMQPVAVRQPRHDRGAVVDPVEPGGDLGKTRRRRDIGYAAPADVRSDHPGEQHRQVAKPRADTGHVRLVFARRDVRRAAIVPLGRDDAAVLDPERTAIGRPPIDCNKIAHLITLGLVACAAIGSLARGGDDPTGRFI